MKDTLSNNCQHYQIPRCQIKNCQIPRLTNLILPKKHNRILEEEIMNNKIIYYTYITQQVEGQLKRWQ